MRREFILDKYHTWHDWRLTLTAKDVTPAEPKTNYVELDGANGSLDLTEALTGEVAYRDRTVVASFWTSEGTFAERLQVLRKITTALHGRKVKIIEPDDPDHYFLGRVVIKAQAQSQVHLELSLEATCDPWRYSVNETERLVDVDGEVDAVIMNHGDKTICPTLVVGGDVSLTFNGVTTKLSAGSYRITDLRLPHGANVVGLSGSGSVAFVYREASL